MKFLYITAKYVSVFYIHSLLAYSIQGTYFKDVFPGSAHNRKHINGVSAINLSRISHLSNIYFDLVQAQLPDFLHHPNLNTNSRPNLLATPSKADFSSSSSDFDANDSSFNTDSADTAQTTHSPEENVDSWRLKRQQGWYIQYGKRNHRTLYSTPKYRTLLSTKIKDDTANRLVTYAEGVPIKMKFSSAISPLDSTGKKALVKSALFKYTELLQAFDDLTSGNYLSHKQFYKRDPDKSDSLANSVIIDGEKYKRQQGWFISYGKRNNGHLPPRLP